MLDTGLYVYLKILNNSHPNYNDIAHLHTAPEVLGVFICCRNPGVDLLGVSPDDVLVRDYYIVKRYGLST